MMTATSWSSSNYLNKPFDPQELLFQIKMAMEDKRPVSQATRLEGSVTERNVCELKGSVEHASAITRHDVIGEKVVLYESGFHEEPSKSFREAVKYFKSDALFAWLES